MKRRSFVPVILLAIAMVTLTSRPARSGPTTGEITITKTTDTTSPFTGSVFDSVINDWVDISATLHVVVKVSFNLSNPSADTCSGVTNVVGTYSAKSRKGIIVRIALNTAYPDAPCPVPGASDRAIIFNLFPVAGCEGLPGGCGGQVFPAILWQRITLDPSGGLAVYQALFGTSTCDPFVNCPPTLLGPP